MKLLGSTKNKITKNENRKNVPRLEMTKVILVHCNIVNNDSQYNSRTLYTFLPNRLPADCQIFHLKTLFLKTFHSEFSCIEIWFTNQNSKLLGIEDKITLL